ncbi:MAG: AAA family ATPase [Colwellia sp.]|nr:AAA family ATPase [Colwellia sp.]
MPSVDQALFISEIHLNSHPYIKQSDIEIVSSNNEKRNIIITGRNGCGKSTLLNLIKSYISASSRNNRALTAHFKSIYDKATEKLSSIPANSPQFAVAKSEVDKAMNDFTDNGGFIKLNFFNQHFLSDKNHVLAYFEAKRLTDLSKPQNITSSQLEPKKIGDHNAGKEFIHHLVNRRSQLAFALEDNSTAEVEEIRNWFTTLDKLFSRLFATPVKLQFLRTQLDFILKTEDGEIIDLKTLSDGYSAVVSMVTEIIMRMEAIQFGGLNVSGVVLIDEVETHLHVALQREILPFLTTMFPHIQFIVTTHSPFVLQSVDNAIIYDLESNQAIDQTAELWKYSYEALIDGYFEVDKFSGILRDKILLFKELVGREDLGRTEKKELRQLRKELESVPTFKNATIETELKQLGLK